MFLSVYTIPGILGISDCTLLHWWKGWAPEGSERKLRTKRSLISEADVYPERMKNKTVMRSRGKGYRDERHFSQRDKTFLSSITTAVCLNPNIISSFLKCLLAACPCCSLTNGINGKLVTKLRCGYSCSQPSDTPSTLFPFPTFIPKWTAILILSSSATTLPRLQQAINDTMSNFKTN